MTFSATITYAQGEQIGGCQGSGAGVTPKGQEGGFRVSVLIRVVVAEIHTCIKIHRALYITKGQLHYVHLKNKL